MAKSGVRDIDFTVARLHARHAEILSGERLDRACTIRTIPELARLRWPEDAPPTMTSAEFQQRVADEFAEEMEFLARNVPQGVRLFFETLQESSRPRRHQSLEEDNAAARKYYETLLDRAKACTPPDDVPALTLARQEAATFIATACLRLVFNYGLSPEAASSCYFGGTPIDAAMFNEAATASDLASALAVFARVVAPDASPTTIAELEGAAWDRYLRLSRRIWAADPVATSSTIGYAGIRRIEVANLITLSEGLRMGVEPKRLRSFLAPHSTR